MEDRIDPGTPQQSSRVRSRISSLVLALGIVGGTTVGGFAGGAAFRYWSESNPATARAAAPAGDLAATATRTSLTPAPDSAAAVYAAVSPAVVTISVSGQGSRGFNSHPVQGEGTGFIVDEQGHILTNNHVVDGAQEVSATLSDGTKLTASVVGTDPGSDLALLKANIPSDKLVVAKLGDSDQLVVGDPVVAIGTPFGLQQTMTSGIVSALKRTFGEAGGRPMRNLIQTDAPINPGNSGGPLLNLQGEVVGITTSIESPVRASVGIGFAIPSNAAKQLLPQLSNGASVDHPYMGISGQALTASLAQQLKLSADAGVVVFDVPSGGPAARAGIRGAATSPDGSITGTGDVITKIDGNKVSSVEDIANYIDGKKVGDTVTLDVLRDGKTIQVPVKLGTWPQSRQS